MEWNVDHGYEIFKLENTKLKHVVDIMKKTYSCREWDLRCILSQHVVCAIYSNILIKSNLLTTGILKAYTYYIQPIPGREHLEPTGKEKIEPPEFRKIGCR